jgi:hypothetical protein
MTDDIETRDASVMTAVPALVGSSRLVAFTSTFCGVEGSVAGAVYKPDVEIVPTLGSSDHMTTLLPVP